MGESESSRPVEVWQRNALQIVLVGVNHRTATVELRERVGFTPEQARRATEELRTRRILEEAVVLSTCNRSELYGVGAEGGDDLAAAMQDYFTAFHRLPPAELDGCAYRQRGSDAVRHLFRVAAGLDSMLLGEAEILGQVRQAYTLALESGATGPVLNRLFQSALEVGKRVRAETDIGTRPMSVAFAGVKLAERIFGQLRGHTALIVGAGTVGEQVVEHLRNRGIARMLVANRSRERGEELAQRVGGEAVAWELLSQILALPEIVVTSVAGAGRVLTQPMAEEAMAARRNRPLLAIDLGVPRNVDSAVGELYNVFLYNVDDLSEIVEQNRKARQAEIPRAEAIVAEQVAKFEAWQASLHGVALLSELREKLQQQREQFLKEKLEKMDHLSREERQRVARLTEELVDRILQEPGERLRNAGEVRRKLEEIAALRELFGLSKEKR